MLHLGNQCNSILGILLHRLCFRTVGKVLWQPMLLLLVFAMVIACDFSWWQRGETVIRLHEDQIDMLLINNAIAEFIIEKGYGYPVERVECTTKEMQRLISQGGIDVALEVWKSNNQDWYRRETALGHILDMGAIYANGHQFWVIPRWVAQEYNIRSVSDMHRHWQLFQDPEDASKGLFFNCITGWTCLEINSVKLEAYGLDKYFNAVSPISPEALRAVYENAQLKRVPAFGYYWAPNSLMASYDWQVLEEPDFSQECWEKVVKAANQKTLRPVDEACEFEHTAVHKFAHQDLAGTAPDVLTMLKKMAVTSEALSNTLTWAIEKGGRQWDEAAIYFLRGYPDQWHKWVSPSALKKIDRALAAVVAP